MRCSRLSSCGFLLALAQPASGADSPPPLRAVSFNVLHGGFGFRGDGQHLNSTADTSGVKRLLADEGLVDTFRTANPHAPGFTVWQPARATVAAGPADSVDHAGKRCTTSPVDPHR